MDLARRRLLIATTLGVGTTARALPAAAPTVVDKVLRYAFEAAETSLDPVKVSDLYSRTLTPHIFEGLYSYDHLARPVKIKPLIAAALPESSSDFRVWTVRLRPGIYFADDPAFKGVRRELVAQDYVYALKRFADPANTSPTWGTVELDGYEGLATLRETALAGKKPFDYDHPIEGVRALDRYTLRYTLAAPRPRFLETLAQGDLYGAVAREVIEFYGSESDAHPVGTGPFRLAEWRRSAFLAFERNPTYRERYYEAEPGPDDAEGQALLARFKGRRLPMVDRVEISIVEEEQPRWLAFVNGQSDLAYRVGYQFAPQAMPGGKVAPHLAKRGIRGYPNLDPSGNFFYFNMDDPVVGGYTAEKVALRRAIGLGIDVQGIIDYAYSGLGARSQGPTVPQTTAYDPALKSEAGDFDPARAQALLDLYGYPLGSDGRRTLADGTPFAITVALTSALRDRKTIEVVSKNLAAIGIRLETRIGQWPDLLKLARAGKLQMWTLGLYASAPDSAGFYAVFDSAQVGGQNLARFKLPAMDRLYADLRLLPDGPQRTARFRAAERLAIAYMPYKFTINRASLDMAGPQLVGYRRTVFWLDWWHHVDIEPALHS
ncbi:MAG: ABC transporter substrate-binding protein [Pseudomonadota bacterium]|nr:ABC transporter substrate-binding protein [Pseudomonadota bacterium]